MSAHDVEHDRQRALDERSSETGRSHTSRSLLNWVLAALAVVAAFAVVAFAYIQVLGTAACTDGACGGVGPSETVFGLILYGTPIVALVALLLSFFTARRRMGIVVPVISWVVVLAALAVLIVTF